jgi:NitT/TauT family transport system substrate-binding protein
MKAEPKASATSSRRVDRKMRVARRLIAAAAYSLVLGTSTTVLSADNKPEKTDVKIAVGGKSFMIYLPLSITERLGYFKDAGLDVEITDFGSGTRSLQALIAGNVDVTAGSFDHAIQMQAKNQPILVVVETGRYPGIVFGLVTKRRIDYRSPKDLKGLKIGITGPGSQTNFLVNYILVKNGLKPADVSFIAVGSPTTAVAAVRNGEIEALSHADPAITQLELAGELTTLFDTRTMAGTEAVFGGSYPSSVMYLRPAFAEKYPKTVQAIVTATVRALRWIAKSTPEEIAKVMPPDYQASNPALYVEIIRKSKAMFSPDGRIDKTGAENAYKVLSSFDEAVSKSKFDVGVTYTDRFVDQALVAQ